MSDPLIIWTVYDHPSDYPDCFVARRWEVRGHDAHVSAEVLVADTLDELRRQITEYMGDDAIVIPRQSNDDPNIVEVWL